MPASISLPFFLHLRQPPPSSLPATMRPHSSRRSERSYGCAELCCLGYTCLQLFWARVVLRKWLNISAKESDFSADTDNEEEDIEEDDDDNVDEFLDAAEELPRPRRRNSETFRAQYINTKDIRICVGTWNVGGRLPPDDLDIEEWLDISKPADIYVLGLQEIVPLNAGNIFGPEDSRPVLRWENIIRETLNRVHPTKRKYKSYSDPPSPSKFKPSEDVPDVVDEILLETDSASEEDEVHPVDEEPSRFYEVRDRTVTTENTTTVSELSTGDGHATMDTLGELETQTQFSSPRRLDRLQCFSSGPRDEDNISVAKAVAKLSKTLSGTERIGLSWPEPPLNLLGQHVLEKPKSFQSTKSYKLGRYSSFKSTTNEDRKDLSDIAMLAELDLELLIRRRRRPEYIRIVSKQMIGIFLTIWVRRSLRKHIQNLKVSTVGVGVMGYIGNKGSISVSMSVYQTLFCFICTHLTSGEKEGDELKRNADVHEIQRRTLFRPESTLSLPKSIHDHEKIIWLGDLNYRINLSYGETRDLISKKQWSKLVERDQLVRELKKGRAFDGWSEGTLNFPPTYKYELNSEKYYGEDPKAGRRTPAWCDRILSFGKGIRLLNYKRFELKLSDHRPVTAAYMVEVEVFSPKKLQRALTFTNAEIENEDIKLGK